MRRSRECSGGYVICGVEEEHTAALSGMWRSPIAKTNREVMTGPPCVDLAMVYGWRSEEVRLRRKCSEVS